MSVPGWEAARTAVRERLGDRAFEHSEAVARSAVLLAETYGVDPDKARIAGLLHDWAREEGPDSLLRQAVAHGVTVGPVDLAVPYLLHAPVGAAMLSKRFPGISGDILSAVRRHTIGAPGMSDLDMVVYVADVIEPYRSFEGVEDLRSRVGVVSLIELYACVYEASLAHLISARKHLHLSTVEAWNDIVERVYRSGSVT